MPAKIREFGPEFKTLLNDFSFLYPNFDQFGGEFSQSLGGSKHLDCPQTLGGFDTVYLPFKQKAGLPDYAQIAHNEEMLHIEQLRRCTSGWALDMLKTQFTVYVNQALHDKLCTKEPSILFTMLDKLARYNYYLESVRIPLEMQTRTRFCSQEFVIKFNNSLVFPPFFKDPLDKRNYLQTIKDQKMFQPSFKMFKRNRKYLANCVSTLGSNPANYLNTSLSTSFSTASSNWIRKVEGAVYSAFSQVETSRTVLKKMFCLQSKLREFPSDVALNPLLNPHEAYPTRKQTLYYDPTARFLECLRVLEKISRKRLRELITKDIQSKSTYYSSATEEYLRQKLKKEGLPPPANPRTSAIVLRNSGKKLFKHVSSRLSLHVPHDLPPLILFRNIYNNDLVLPSEISKLLSDDIAPSILITSDDHRNSFIAKIVNEDVISNRYMKDLELFFQGTKIISRAEDIAGNLDVRTEVYKYTTRQRIVLCLHFMSFEIIPSKDKQEIVQAMGIQKWPVTINELSRILRLRADNVKKFTKNCHPELAKSSEYGLQLEKFISELVDFLQAFRLCATVKGSSRTHDGAWKDVIAAFEYTNIFNDYNTNTYNKVCKAVRDGGYSVPESSTEYTWNELTKELSDATQFFLGNNYEQWLPWEVQYFVKQ